MENNAVGKEPYMVFDPPAAPTQETGVPGLRFDFNNGSGCQCRREITGCGSLTVTVI